MGMWGPTLLLAEADHAIATRLAKSAKQIGIGTTWCRDGAEALISVGAVPPDVLVIAARIEAVDASSVVSAVRRRWDLPILVGTGDGDEELSQQALAAGASAVIARPYAITAIAPFAFKSKQRSTEDPAVLIAGPIYVDRRGHETRVGGRDVQLTHRELELLIFLIERHGRVASSEEISRVVWGRPSETNTVAVHVKRLREKLGRDAEHGQFIRTIRGAGYRLAPSVCA